MVSVTVKEDYDAMDYIKEEPVDGFLDMNEPPGDCKKEMFACEVKDENVFQENFVFQQELDTILGSGLLDDNKNSKRKDSQVKL